MGGFVRIVAVVAALALPATAQAVDPESVVGGNGSKWFSGSLLQQSGNNCSIIGGSYSETMVSAIASYGGAPNQKIVHVGDRYYAEVLISIPGNPCGSGSSVVGTDLVLPRGTSVDTTAPIRCFGQPRNSNDPGELTGGSWQFMNSSGPYCPSQVGSSLTGTSGAVGVGFRPLANGQLYWLFVPIRSTQSLEGAGHNPADEIRWVLSSSGTYDNQGSTYVWANVPTGQGDTPFIYFARNPSVVPYWDAAAPAGQENKVEWFANLYSAGYAGTLCWKLDNVPSQPPPNTCADDSGWNGTVTAGPDSWQVFGHGPNDGYVPFYYTLANSTFEITWEFTYNPGGGNVTVNKKIQFTTLPGPDTDGDGVADSQDACPSTKGTLANGCQPSVQTDPDGDGVFGSADKCPDKNGGSAPDGCPPPPAATPATGGQQPPSTPGPSGGGVTPATALTASLGALKGLKRVALIKGLTIPVKCSQDSKVAMTLTVTAAVAKKLKIPVKRKQARVPIGSAAGTCTAAAGGKLKLKVKPAFAKKVRKPKKGFAAKLATVFSRPGSPPVAVNRLLSLR